MYGVLILAGVLLVVLLFIWGLTQLDREKKKTPEDQLAGRFARGAIGEGEYLRNLAILQHGTDFVLEAERAPLVREPRPADS
ncbi:MAG: hypothetical protein QOD30_2091 [Actinomycetota bacterium]|jgi:uncharacterized membrane protein|nr:hypothetical protein [Actinomycetota bacterium]